MNFLTGSSGNSWQPVVTADTTAPSYWFNWRFLFSATWVLMSMVFAFFLISKLEGPHGLRRENRERQKEAPGILYDDEVWKPCLKGTHPAQLLAFRVVAFFVLLILLILNVAVNGGGIFYFYTQWTFTLVTIYFGLGSILSLYGCFKYQNMAGGDGTNNQEFDAEQNSYGGDHRYARNSNAPNGSKHLRTSQGHDVHQIAGFWGYVFQIIFQMNAGAVILTDCVFWFILVPILTIKDYNLNFLVIIMHSINVVFLLGDTALNSLRFPWFRIGYFFLWTSVYVIFQWIIHACISLWWPYPFLDLSSPFAPVWYATMAMMHIPCFGIFVLVIKMKHFLFSKLFPESYQGAR
ncbi:hypothetical protein NMG60_11019324 [Bertholletia excelsa]